MSPYSPVDRWLLPREVLALSMTEMAIDGRLGCEGVALWLGKRENSVATITHVVALRGRGVSKRFDLLNISAELLNDVTDLAIDLGLMLVGQIHSHAPWFGTDLSPTDRMCGINVPDYLSVVAPDFALRRGTTIADCGVHVYVAGLGYERLERSEVSKRIHSVDGAAAMLTVGKE